MTSHPDYNYDLDPQIVGDPHFPWETLFLLLAFCAFLCYKGVASD